MTVNMNKFKRGDKVKVDYDANIYEVIYFEQLFNLYTISGVDGAGKTFYKEVAEHELKSASTTFSIPSGVGSVTLKAYMQNNYTFDDAAKDFNKQMSKLITDSEKSLEKSCQHEFKFYFGLNERFEFCTKCDLKKGHL